MPKLQLIPVPPPGKPPYESNYHQAIYQSLNVLLNAYNKGTLTGTTTVTTTSSGAAGGGGTSGTSGTGGTGASTATELTTSEASGASAGAPTGQRQVMLTGTVSGGLVVSTKGVLADVTEPFEALGIALQSGNAGTAIYFAPDGIVEESGWTWTPDLPVFLGSAGALTQVVPQTGYIMVIGFAQSPTTILVRLGSPVQQ
jgi:hypothetical protein